MISTKNKIEPNFSESLSGFENGYGAQLENKMDVMAFARKKWDWNLDCFRKTYPHLNYHKMI